jgi:hypothetical protein
MTSWTCARCEVTVSFSPEVERPSLPSTWAPVNGELHCLGCRRELAADEGLEAAEEGLSSQRRLQIRSQARVEFEIKRDPSRQDNQIAKACGTSVFKVRKVRTNLGLESPHRA